MEDLLKKMSKEDLIKVIAEMHDTIQEWDNGRGLNDEDGKKLIIVGSAAVNYCIKNNWDYELPIKN